MILPRLLLPLLFSLAIVATPARAQLLNFDFSTTGTNGTVTGEIIGLQSSGSSTPSQIIILSQPAGYITGPESLLSSGYAFYNNDDLFTVTAGEITNADVAVYQIFGGTNYQAYGWNVTDAGFTNANGIYQDDNGVITSNYSSNGFAGTTYTPVPEPRREALIFVFLGLALLAFRKLRFWNAWRLNH